MSMRSRVISKSVCVLYNKIASSRRRNTFAQNFLRCEAFGDRRCGFTRLVVGRGTTTDNFGFL